VDLLEGEEGPLVLEVNSSPGLEGIEKASKVNVAAAIIEYIMDDWEFSDVNISQLLRTQTGSSVLSIHLRNHPKLIGRNIEELFAEQIKMPLFAISRDNDLIWNPDGALQLRYDDILICYGKTDTLRNTLKRAMKIDSNINSQYINYQSNTNDNSRDIISQQ
jgi:ribosomal protein S6--L-glutamate ligase